MPKCLYCEVGLNKKLIKAFNTLNGAALKEVVMFQFHDFVVKLSCLCHVGLPKMLIPDHTLS